MAASPSANSYLTRQSSVFSLTVAELQSCIARDPATNPGSIVVDCGGAEAAEVTLEEFLTRAGAVMEEDVRGVFASNSAMQQESMPQIPAQMFGNGAESSGGRGGEKRKLLNSCDRVALQKQKRMIKNRESAARSRDRKQAYTAELESLVMQLEVENSELMRHQEERRRKRLKQMMEDAIPVMEMGKPRRPLRRIHSMLW